MPLTPDVVAACDQAEAAVADVSRGLVACMTLALQWHDTPTAALAALREVVDTTLAELAEVFEC